MDRRSYEQSLTVTAKTFTLSDNLPYLMARLIQPATKEETQLGDAKDSAG
jgi:hypothetical protein